MAYDGRYVNTAPPVDTLNRVEATVADTGQLRWWLLGFGGRVEVQEPLGLREELKNHAVRMVGRYT
jgi:predicted DNA-binding transcriptional regulator YafY